jgi:voltage-gated potassium channel
VLHLPPFAVALRPRLSTSPVLSSSRRRPVGGSVETLVDTKDFHWEGIWWAVVTVTTVGYGDAVPHSVEGQIVAMVVMLVGIGFLSVLTASIACVFVKTDRGDETEAILTALAVLREEVAELRQRFAS